MKPCGPISSSPFRPCRTSLPARNKKDGPPKNGIITLFYTSQVVQDSFHQQYDVAFIRGHVYIHAAFRILNDNLLKKNDLFKLQKELSQQWMGASASMFSNLLLVQKRTIYSGSGSYGKTFGFGWYASAQATQRYLVATPFASAVRVWAVACESLHKLHHALHTLWTHWFLSTLSAATVFWDNTSGLRYNQVLVGQRYICHCRKWVLSRVFPASHGVVNDCIFRTWPSPKVEGTRLASKGDDQQTLMPRDEDLPVRTNRTNRSWNVA